MPHDAVQIPEAFAAPRLSSQSVTSAVSNDEGGIRARARWRTIARNLKPLLCVAVYHGSRSQLQLEEQQGASGGAAQVRRVCDR